MVIRNGVTVEIDSADLVMGDVVVLKCVPFVMWAPHRARLCPQLNVFCITLSF